ncbi:MULTISPECIES: hypothetical protein [unclassified Methylobacterium]|jgi:hypothetical protein|uniref:hypothetical protein n=1 Tax=unclassified Methylobacterium TaxID=2615210 RepID=UPI001354587C|nr:hypothetical protein [Methylobacterium sp. 2A]MWV21489.1 hypothetical protein [Methylobacterium sp. 2A]
MAQQRPVRSHRARGLVRFAVVGRDTDRGLLQSLATLLAEDTPQASELRATVSRSVAGEPSPRGGILAALRRSPLVGADLDLTRGRDERPVPDL